MHKSPIDERVEELLELIWVMREDGIKEKQLLLSAAESHGEDEPAEVLAEVESRGLLNQGDVLVLTEKGELTARSVVRRHRLAERLLSDVLDIEPKTMAEAACQFEHVLSPEVTVSICTLLGHPPTCPHGRKIPPGTCCGSFDTELKPLVIRLSELGVGERASVKFLAGGMDGLERLGALGLVPGVGVRLIQRRPSHVVEVGETTIAIDTGLASAIYVRRS
jgi:DtxR family Mn-dependent transcriptional regulator